MKLTITKKPFKGRPVGSEFDANDRQARLLVKMGRGQYMTRDMVAAPVSAPAPSPAPMPPPAPAPAPAPAVDAPPAALRFISVDGAPVAIDEMEAEALHALAKQLDVKVHHASGAEKVRLALVDSQRAPE